MSSLLHFSYPTELFQVHFVFHDSQRQRRLPVEIQERLTIRKILRIHLTKLKVHKQKDRSLGRNIQPISATLLRIKTPPLGPGRSWGAIFRLGKNASNSNSG